MRIGIVLNGDPPSQAELELLDDCETILCADGAAKHLLAAQKPPTMIVGDLDSLDADTYNWADALGIQIERHPTKKDETDGELTIERAFQMGASELVMIGGHGGRMAMFLGNLKLLRRAHERGLNAFMMGNGESMRFVDGSQDLILNDVVGMTLNILPIDADATVTLTGTQWDGTVTLESRSVQGASNEVRQDGATIKVESGIVLVILEKAE